jgi:hypothetical protein
VPIVSAALIDIFGNMPDSEKLKSGRDALLAWNGRQCVVLVAGMIRSGSTWLYNAVRLVCAAGEDNCAQGFWIEDFNPASVQAINWLVIKAHLPDPDLAARSDFIITSHRDLRDIAASAGDMGWAEAGGDLASFAMSARVCDEFWAPKAHLDISYDDIVGQAASVVSSVASALNIRVAGDQVDDILTVLSKMEPSPSIDGPYDKTTLLHVRHKFDGRPGRWRDTLETAVAERIVADHGDWLSTRGYLDPR